MVTILDVDVIVGVLDQRFEARQQKGVTGLTHISRVLQGQLQKNVFSGAGRLLLVAPLHAANTPVGVAQAQVEAAGSGLEIGREDGFRDPGVVRMDQILEIDLASEESALVITEQGFRTTPD